VLRSLAFWLCLLLAAGGYGLATLAPSYVRNQQLNAEYAAADAELRRLITQVDRYERYCRRLTAAEGGGAAARGGGTAAAAPLPRPSPPQHVGSSRGVERGGEGASGFASGKADVPSQQMAVEASLQFQLEAAAAEPTAPLTVVSPPIAWLSRSSMARGMLRICSAVLLLLAFTLCLDLPGERLAPVVPCRPLRRTRNPLAWLGMRYRSADSGGPN
jgi:hypothetical protein